MNSVSFSIPFEFNGKHYVCEVNPIRKFWDKTPRTFQITLNDVYFGIITFTGNTWESDTSKNMLVERIGRLIHESYTSQAV
jgi:hypothetical protein